jgi:hypothetical protein
MYTAQNGKTGEKMKTVSLNNPSNAKEILPVAMSPVNLAPIRSAAEIRTGSTEVGSRATQATPTPLVHDGTAILLSASGTLRWWRRGWNRALVTNAETRLTTGTTVVGLSLFPILRPAVTINRTTTVVKSSGAGTRARNTA